MHLYLVPGDALPEEHISREEDGSGKSMLPNSEPSPFVPRPLLRPNQQLPAAAPNEFEAPPF